MLPHQKKCRGLTTTAPLLFFLVVAMNRVDVVEPVVDLDVNLVHVDLAVPLCDGPRAILYSFGRVASTCFIYFLPRRVLILFLFLGPTCF